MRILEAVSQAGRNGAMIYARRIIPLLRDRGHEVWLAARPDSWIAQETAGEARLVPTDFARWPLAELRRIADLCRNERIDVVHSHLTRAANFCALLRRWKGVPSVAHAHSHHFQPHWYFHDLVVAVSAQTLRCHRRRLAALGSRGRVLHNFADLVKFAPRAKSALAGLDPLRTAFGIPAEAPVVLHLAEICERKGQLVALRAAARVRREWPETHFVFIGADRGTGPHKEQVRAAVEQGGVGAVVHWAGRREDVAALLPHATIAILPSLDDPFALAGLEIMACGLPLVASRVGGFPEMVVDGATGLLVPPRDDGALAAALLDLLRDPIRREAMGAAARARAEAVFSPEAHILGLEAALAAGVRRAHRA